MYIIVSFLRKGEKMICIVIVEKINVILKLDSYNISWQHGKVNLNVIAFFGKIFKRTSNGSD